MDILKSRLKAALGLDDESVAELAQYVAFQGTPQAMESALEDIIGDKPSAKDIIAQYFEHTGENNLKKKAREERDREAAAAAAREASPSRSKHSTPLIGMDHEQMNYTNFVSGKGAWGKDGQKAKKPVHQKSSGSSTPSSSKVKIDSLSDIEAALNQIDITSTRGRRVPCNCMGSRHPLVEAAPNCLHCGKIICIKEGLGPCLSCGAPLISEENMQAIADILNTEKDEIASTMGRKARETAADRGISISDNQVREAKNRAKDEADKRLNKLLDFQDTSILRTKIIDEVSDFEVPTTGLNKWASPSEQAKQLKKQQRQMRKLEEQRLARSGRGRKVISIDLHGKKVVMIEQAPEKDDFESPEDDDEEEDGNALIKEPKTKPADKFWDSKSYGKNFIKPIYVESESRDSKKGHEKNRLPVPESELTGNSKLDYDGDEDDLAASWSTAF